MGMFHQNRYKVNDHFVDSRRNSKQGRAIILVHGIGASGNYFMPLAELLARNYDVHVLDMPGYGKTPKPPRPLTLIQQADILAGYIKKLGLPHAVIVGQSMGCQTGALFAARHGKLCEKLILIGPTVNKWERQRSIQALRLLRVSFAEPLKANLIVLRDYFRMGVRPYWITSRYMISDRIEETIKQVHVPICIIRGTKDRIAPKKWVEHLAEIANESEVHHIERHTHNVHFSNAKVVSAIC